LYNVECNWGMSSLEDIYDSSLKLEYFDFTCYFRSNELTRDKGHVSVDSLPWCLKVGMAVVLSSSVTSIEELG